MNYIRSWLAIGKYRETLDEQMLVTKKIGAVLQLAESISYDTLDALYLPVEDGVPLPHDLVRQGLHFVLRKKQEGKCVLIACGAGISRSAAFAVAALKDAERLTLLEAMRMVSEHHPDAMPHPAIWESLCAYYDEPNSVDEMLSIRHQALST